MNTQLKELYVDLETTGLTPGAHAVIQIAAIAYFGGQEVATFNDTGRPFTGQKIDAGALRQNGRTPEEIGGFQPALELHRKFTDFLATHVDRFTSSDKFHFIAYNSHFDNEHLREFFVRAQDKWFGSFFWTPDICVMRKAAQVLKAERHQIENFKLATVAKHVGVLTGQEKLHDALDDIRLTVALDRELDRRIAAQYATTREEVAA